MKLLILGPPGTGKGTQAQFIAHYYKLKHLSTGEILRAEYTKGTKIGIEAALYWMKGNLAPEEIVMQILKKNIPEDNFLLDGFPRTIEQATWLEHNYPIDKAVYLNSSEKNIIDRLLKRAQVEGRKDDTLKAITNRIDVYRKQTAPLLDFYKDKLVTINGDQSVERVSQEIIRKLA